MSKFGKVTCIVGFGLASALAAFSGSAIAAKARSGEPAAQQQAAPAPPANATEQERRPMMMGQNMMAMRQKMMADDKAADSRLQPLIEKMNAAKGEAKVDAMAAVLTELIRQRTGTREQMGQLSQMMMPNMMGMMMQGMTADMRKWAAQCPMMKGFGETPPKP